MALAYWYARQNRYQEAQNRLNKLKQTAINTSAADKMNFDILLAITEAQIAGFQDKWQLAEKALTPYYNLYPERRDLKLLMADAWLQLGKYNEVVTLMKPIVQSRPHDLEGLYRIQRAYELMAIDKKASGNGPTSQALVNDIAAINALRYRAKGELWRGKYNDALVSLQQAKKQVEELSASGNTVTFNPKPLLANINSEMAEVKTARDFRP